MNKKELPQDELITLYKQGKSTRWLANKFSVNQRTIRLRLISLGVRLRNQKEVAQNYRPVGHRWKGGGKDFIKFESRLALTNAGVDLHTCSKCKVVNIVYKHPIHHINKDRHDNRVENLEVLCPTCHANAHRRKSIFDVDYGRLAQ